MIGFLVLWSVALAFLLVALLLPWVAIATVQELRDALQRWREERATMSAPWSADRVIAAVIALVGGYYIFRAVVTLVDLPGVTGRWVVLSGDADFPADFGLFLLAIGIGAAVVLSFGVSSVAAGAVTALGERTCAWHVKALTIAAPVVHLVWFMYRVIASGSSSDATLTLAMFALRGALVCGALVVLWVLTRRPPLLTSPA
jgi:hypothetical protein